MMALHQMHKDFSCTTHFVHEISYYYDSTCGTKISILLGLGKKIEGMRLWIGKSTFNLKLWICAILICWHGIRCVWSVACCFEMYFCHYSTTTSSKLMRSVYKQIIDVQKWQVLLLLLICTLHGQSVLTSSHITMVHSLWFFLLSWNISSSSMSLEVTVKYFNRPDYNLRLCHYLMFCVIQWYLQ